ncbi:unnamed protein product [Rodentolepis nana]|uniref:Cyclin_C domain-containing protein n=1 Tax=Rodentolepis nana TaxID=102285 RepID=A0A0R3T0S0_RODNA|nr:unnamed protein product [Rodentolepis nana]
MRIRKGKCRKFAWSVRDPRLNVLQNEVLWAFYSDYVMGCHILSSYSKAELLALALFFTEQFPIEDAYIGLVASRLDISSLGEQY